MSWIIYPALQQPVLTDAQRTEATTIERYHRPFAEPVRHRIRPGLAVALMASGAVISPYGLTQPEAVSIDKWQLPLAEPQRSRSLPRAAAPAAATVEAPIETVTADKWFAPLSEKPRTRTLATGQVPAAFLTQAAPFEEVSSPDKWFAHLSLPVRVRPRLAAAQNPALFYGRAAPFSETVLADKWFARFPEPVRFPRALKVHLQRSPFLVSAAPFGETISPDKWFAPLSLPKRRIEYRPQVAPYHPFVNIESGGAPVVFDQLDYFQPFSEPVRFKPGLAAAQHPQPFFVAIRYIPTIEPGQGGGVWIGDQTLPYQQPAGDAGLVTATGTANRVSATGHGGTVTVAGRAIKYRVNKPRA